MLIGNCSIFAIEFKLDKEYGEAWLYGKLCFWINNQRIGDYDLGTSLRDVLFELKYIVSDNGNRNHKELYLLSKEELYYRLNSVLYGYEASEFEKEALDDTWARFNATIPIDVFCGWKIFVVENVDKTRVIAKNDDSEILELIMLSKEFNDVINCFYLELNKLYDSEIEKGMHNKK